MADQVGLWRSWAQAAARAEVDDALRSLYRALEADVSSRKPTCWLSGRCCKFETYGHRLYVTGLEIAWLISKLDESGRTRLASAQLPGLDGCPFQVDGMCSVHPIRPLGCRIYFCDANARSWQNPVYERFLQELRLLHEQFALEYRYVEWRQGFMEARTILSGSAIAVAGGRTVWRG